MISSKNELVDACETRGVHSCGNKTDLIERITLHFELLSNVAAEEEGLELMKTRSSLHATHVLSVKHKWAQLLFVAIFHFSLK